MLSSIASYLFGSNTTATNPNPSETKESGDIEENVVNNPTKVDVDNLIEVTSLTPSVTGTGAISSGSATVNNARAIRRGKNKRNNTRQQNKRKGGGVRNNSTKSTESTKSLTKTSSSASPSDSCDEDFDEDEWFIVEKEDDEDVSQSRKENEKETIEPTLEVVKSVKQPTIAPSPLAQQRRQQHINSHSLYSGPRPQKQRNFLQKSRTNNTTQANNVNNRSSGLSVSTLSPSRTVNESRNGKPNTGMTADAGGISRSLYVAATSASATAALIQPDKVKVAPVNGIMGNVKSMDESWFVTPPPCFTSIGPINMEASPYENLLIEHPSMSVYHSIRSVQEDTAESYIEFDLDDVKKAKKDKKLANNKENVQRKNSQAVQQRSSAGFRLDRQSVAQLKQELMARSAQKTQSKKERKDICRSAIKRANKVRDVQSKNHTSRRADRQYFKAVSGTNNNRNSHF
ncbi:tumor protein p53 inducible nuclear protein isoform X1 [Musca autumnalis]|uniref:tumor protein p53 inducible nuclear protein isoform X1 n=1 Tax=Musca autumnalis TaxID=221902 RepID=UPI003CEDB02F